MFRRFQAQPAGPAPVAGANEPTGIEASEEPPGYGANGDWFIEISPSKFQKFRQQEMKWFSIEPEQQKLKTSMISFQEYLDGEHTQQ